MSSRCHDLLPRCLTTACLHNGGGNLMESISEIRHWCVYLTDLELTSERLTDYSIPLKRAHVMCFVQGPGL